MKNCYLFSIILFILFCFTFNEKATAGLHFSFSPPENYSADDAGDSNYAALKQMFQDKLDAMVDAYNSRNAGAFMRQVSGDFAEDKDYLDSAVRNDFFKYSYININFIISSIIPDNKGKYAVNISFNRMLEDRRTGKMKSDSGFTTLIFVKKGDRIKLLSQKSPRLFGININN